MWQKNQRDGTFEAFMLNIGGKLPDRNLYSYLHSKSPLNSAPIRGDTKLDEFVEAQARELNVEKRKQILVDMQKHLLDQLYHIPTIDLIDFDYIYWHTADDTLDKLSPDSLKTVGAVTLFYLRSVKF